MRRLLLGIVVLALFALVVSSGAGAAKSGARLRIQGSAHAAGDKLQGGFTFENQGTAKSPLLTATVKLIGAPLHSKVLGKLTVQHAAIHVLAPGAKQRVKVKASIPSKAASGSWSILACARRCVQIGKLTGTTATPAPGPKAPSGPSPPPAQQLCPIPSPPIVYTAGEPFRHAGCGVEYWGFVPSSYNPANPAPLLIWLHGCGGESGGDIYTVDPGAEGEPQDWLSLTLVGHEAPGDECWTPSADETKVMQALTDLESHLDVDPRRVILGGYSSGGDLAYRTGFRHSSTFAGLLIENSSPFRDTESTEAESLAAATTKLHIVHLAHLQDTTYPIAGVRTETEAVEAAGFPIERIERPGEHYDANTDSDLREYLLPHIDDGWLAAAP